MEFTIYTFGDVEIFRAALAGVAMIFNADGFFVSDSGLGLGALTALGLLLGLVVILLNSIITQKADLGGFVVMVLVFAVLFVPKFSVNVEDYNGDAIAKVDNVPLGVALPAGLVSGLAREMNIRMGTAFSTTEGYPSGLMTPEALRSPLKMLLSLRNGYTLVPERTPVLLSNLTNLVAYCVAGRNFTAPNAQTVKIKDAPITHLLELAETVNGLTMYADPVTKANELRPCKDVAREIASAIDSLYDSSDLTEIMTAAAARTGAAPIRLTAGRPEVQPVTGELMMDNLSMLFQVSGRSAESFIKTSLLMPYVARAHLCADSNSDPVMWAQCMPFQSQVIQWQEDEAAAGTAFQRIMFHGMNALFFIWICLSPVVAVLMLMMGVRGLKLAGSFLMFGAWTVSWYVGASVVNFYMLKQLQYELAMLGSFDNLTPATIGWFFDTIQNKIAVAGTMMSSVPLIMMTIMSGSMYGMVQLASRWGGKDYYDEKVNSPSAFGSAPGYTPQSAGKLVFGRGGVEMMGRHDAGTLSNASDMSHLLSTSRESTMQQASKLQRTFSSDLANTSGSSRMWEYGSAANNALRSAGMSETATLKSITDKIANSSSRDTQVGRDWVKASNFAMGIGGDTPIGGMKLGVAEQLRNSSGVHFTEEESKMIERMGTDTNAVRQTLSKEHTAENIAKFAHTAKMDESIKTTTSFGNTVEASEAYAEAKRDMDSVQTSVGYATNLKFFDIGTSMENNGGDAVISTINTAWHTAVSANPSLITPDSEGNTPLSKSLAFFKNGTNAGELLHVEELARLRAMALSSPELATKLAAELSGTGKIDVKVDSVETRNHSEELKPASELSGAKRSVSMESVTSKVSQLVAQANTDIKATTISTAPSMPKPEVNVRPPDKQSPVHESNLPFVEAPVQQAQQKVSKFVSDKVKSMLLPKDSPPAPESTNVGKIPKG